MGRSSVAKCPEIGPTTSTCGWPATSGLRKCRTSANGVDSTGSTTTSAARPSTSTVSMPQSGRTCVARASATSRQAARTRRAPGSPASGAGSASRARAVSADVVRAGAVSRRCHSYAV
ncbi:MAG TPA: hypothetical protein VE823_00590 [Geodermatophilus sp.]|nr:hypothetical protein [Geodermatophilus sp.]